MQKILRLLFWTISLSAVLSCEKREEETVIEQHIFAALLPEMIDTIYKDPEIYLNFQDPSNVIGSDSLHQAAPISKRNDNRKITVAVYEILNFPADDDLESMQQIIKSNKLKINISNNKIAHKLTLPAYQNKSYSFKYFTKPAENEGVIYAMGNSTVKISVSFSKILFDEKKEYGIFSGNYDCRPKCGLGYIIVVRKSSEGWKIYKVFDTWIS